MAGVEGVFVVAARREQILQAALELLSESGPGAVTVRAVAGRAGLGASTLRYYFPSQLELLEAVQAYALDLRVGDLRILDRAIPAAERLTECMAQFLPPLQAEPATPQPAGPGAGLQPLQLTAQGTAASPEAATQLMGALTVRARERVMYWLGVLYAEGQLRNRDPVQLTTLLLATVNGLYLEVVSPLALTTGKQARELLADVIDRTVLLPAVFHPPGPRRSWPAIAVTPRSR